MSDFEPLEQVREYRRTEIKQLSYGVECLERLVDSVCNVESALSGDDAIVAFGCLFSNIGHLLRIEYGVVSLFVPLLRKYFESGEANKLKALMDNMYICLEV